LGLSVSKISENALKEATMRLQTPVPAAQIYHAVLPLARRGDVVLIDAKYNVEYLRKVRRYLERTLKVSSVAVGHISDKAIERTDRLSKLFSKRSIMMKKTLTFLKFVRLIHPAREARFTP